MASLNCEWAAELVDDLRLTVRLGVQQMHLRQMSQQQQQQLQQVQAQRMLHAQQQMAMAQQAHYRGLAPGAGLPHAGGLPASAYRGSLANAASQACALCEQRLRAGICVSWLHEGHGVWWLGFEYVVGVWYAVSVRTRGVDLACKVWDSNIPSLQSCIHQS